MIHHWLVEAREGVRDFAVMLQDLLISVQQRVAR